MDYRPTTWPGARLPHFWVARDGARMPIHDILAPDRFVLLTDREGAGAWREAADRVTQHLGIALAVVSVGGHDADLVDADGAWRSASEVGVSGGVLVRPDGHVAWRANALPEDPAATLAEVFARIGLTRES
jgi:2,4-dichlorophenol 6-monooxygenase